MTSGKYILRRQKLWTSEKRMSDILIITDVCDSTKKPAYLLINSFKTLKGKQPRVFIRNIHDSDKNIDEIRRCKKAIFLLSRRTNSLNHFVPRWSNTLRCLRIHQSKILIIQEGLNVDTGLCLTENELVAGIVQKECLKEIQSFHMLPLWWPTVIKFVFDLNSANQTVNGTYRFANEELAGNNRRVKEIVKKTLLCFGIEETLYSQYRISFQRDGNIRYIRPLPTVEFYFEELTDQKISDGLLTILTDLKVFYTNICPKCRPECPSCPECPECSKCLTSCLEIICCSILGLTPLIIVIVIVIVPRILNANST